MENEFHSMRVLCILSPGPWHSNSLRGGVLFQVGGPLCGRRLSPWSKGTVIAEKSLSVIKYTSNDDVLKW